ncbi:hypothetical protein D3C85_1465500 [compost metagenome]
MHRAGWSITVLADDQFGGTLCLAVLVIDLIPIDEQDQVGVLLDGAGLAQVGQQWAFVAALLQGAIELGQGDHRTTQLLGQRFERGRDFGDFQMAILLGGGLHQL